METGSAVFFFLSPLPPLHSLVDVCLQDDEIEFKEFIAALSTFSEKGNTEAKLKFAFQV